LDYAFNKIGPGKMDKLEEILKKLQEEVSTIAENFKDLFRKKSKEPVSPSEKKEGIEVIEDKEESENEDTASLNKTSLFEFDKSDLDSGKGIKKYFQLDKESLRKNGLKIFLIIAISFFAIDTFFFEKRSKISNKSKTSLRKKMENSLTKKKVKKIEKNIKIKKTSTREKTAIVDAPKESKETLRNAIKDIPPETSTTVLEKKNKIQEKNEASVKTSTIVQEEKIKTIKLKEDQKITDEVPSPFNLGETDEKTAVKDELGKQIKDVINNSIQAESEETMYVSPPTYQRFGRGLVYNCKGGHWACVDHYSYIKCLENEKYNSEKEKPLECVVKNTYASSNDCIKVQTFYTNNNEETSFCSGQK